MLYRYKPNKTKDMYFISIKDAEKMIGKRVQAVGTCGMKKDVTVFGILEEVENSDTIVQIPFGSKGHTIPCSVNINTLKLVNGTCDNCSSVISDAEAFNQVCFGCGKKV